MTRAKPYSGNKPTRKNSCCDRRNSPAPSDLGALLCFPGEVQRLPKYCLHPASTNFYSPASLACPFNAAESP